MTWIPTSCRSRLVVDGTGMRCQKTARWKRVDQGAGSQEDRSIKSGNAKGSSGYSISEHSFWMLTTSNRRGIRQ